MQPKLGYYANVYAYRGKTGIFGWQPFRGKSSTSSNLNSRVRIVAIRGEHGTTYLPGTRLARGVLANPPHSYREGANPLWALIHSGGGAYAREDELKLADARREAQGPRRQQRESAEEYYRRTGFAYGAGPGEELP